MRPKTTFVLFMNRLASSPQKAANCAWVAALGSLVSPMIEPVVGCWLGSLYLVKRI